MGDWFSIYWVAPLSAWVVAQAAKVAYAYARGDKSESRPTFLSSGNMPSSHSAITVALVVVIGVIDGIHSAAFGIASVLTAIVIYDALNVRRAVGEQGLALRSLIKESNFFNALGHKPTEVAAGAFIGILVAFVLLQIL
jgi:acid phosphatase family membrane protein YuiD